MKKLLTVAAMAEVVTGLALLVVPSLVGRLLFGAEVDRSRRTDSPRTRHRLDRIRGRLLAGSTRAVYGMLTYGALVTLYLLYLGIRGKWVGPLLWPAVVLHAVLVSR